MERSIFRARVMAHMAGAEAEGALLGSCIGGDVFDRAEIAARLDRMGGGERQDNRSRQEMRQPLHISYSVAV